MGKVIQLFPNGTSENRMRESIIKVNKLIAEMKEIESTAKNVSSSDAVIPKRETNNKGRDV